MLCKWLLYALPTVLLGIQYCSAIWCYSCTSAIPGCGQNFTWQGVGYLGERCPEDDDICVKVIERRGVSETITRDCLSRLRGFRTDIPSDKYEGCRPAVRDEQLGHYVNNSIKELDIYRNFYNNITFCFCFLDHRCNSAGSLDYQWIVITMLVIFSTIFRAKRY